MPDKPSVCTECGMTVKHPRQYHPYLFCELYKLGYLDPEDHLKRYGYHRDGPFDQHGWPVKP